MHVLAGTYVSDLHVMLSSAQPPLALSNVGSISEQTIGGLLATATHGTGIRFPVISAYARELTLICPLPASQGGTQLVRCSRAERPELFNASLCGLGSTGLIVSVRLAVEPAFRLRQTAEEVPFEFLFGKPVQQTIDALGGAPSGRVVAGEGAALQFASQHNDSIGHLLARGRRLPRARSRRLPATRIADPARIWPSASGGAVAVQGDAQLDDEETREAQRRLEEVVNSAQHVRCMWFPQVAMCTLLRADRTYEVSA